MSQRLLYGQRKLLRNGVDDRFTTQDMAINTPLMMKHVFGLSLRALQGFVDSIFKLMGLPLKYPDYSLLSKQTTTVNISIKTSTRGENTHFVIDSTGLKVFDEGEKVRQHGVNKRRVWRKLHLAVDSTTHEIICADLSHNSTTDVQALLDLIKQTHRKIRESRLMVFTIHTYCHDALLMEENKGAYPTAKWYAILARPIS